MCAMWNVRVPHHAARVAWVCRAMAPDPPVEPL
jgi:hypothetical protein